MKYRRVYFVVVTLKIFNTFLERKLVNFIYEGSFWVDKGGGLYLKTMIIAEPKNNLKILCEICVLKRCNRTCRKMILKSLKLLIIICYK